jgi:dolichol-phosphate mannosyltransferase
MSTAKINAVKMNRGDFFAFASHFLSSPRLIQFIKFCLVGGSGVVVDMTVLFLLADPRYLGLSLSVSKIVAAEAALTNNFLWNELWTFKPAANSAHKHQGWFRRLLAFNAICGIGIGLAVILLHTFHSWLGWNLYLSNLVAIMLVTCWNFGINARFNWHKQAQMPDVLKELR